jgi:hypothetical protein
MSRRRLLNACRTVTFLVLTSLALSCSGEPPPAEAADAGAKEAAPHPFPGPALADVRRTFMSAEPPFGDYGFEITCRQPVTMAIPRNLDDPGPHNAVDLPGSLRPHRIIQRATTVQAELATCTCVDAAPTAEVPGSLMNVAWDGVEHDDTRLAYCAEDGTTLHAGHNVLWEAELLLKGKVVGRNSLGVIVPEGTPVLEAPPLEPADWPAEAEDYLRHVGVVFAAETAGPRFEPHDGIGFMIAQTLPEPVTQATPLKVLLINHGDRPVTRLSGALVRRGRNYSAECPPLEIEQPVPPGEAATFDVALPPTWEFALHEMHKELPLQIWELELGESVERRPSP